MIPIVALAALTLLAKPLPERAPSAAAAERYAAAAAYSESEGGIALIVIEGDAVVFARHARRAHPIYSGVKGFLCPLAMALVEDGQLGLEDPAGPVFPSPDAAAVPAPVRVRDLLTMTSGLDEARWWQEVDNAPARKTPDDRYAFARRLPVVLPPGHAFQYSGVHASAFGAVVVARRLDPRRVLSQRVIRPLGMRPARWASDGAGHALLTHGMSLSADGFARLGMLLRDDGVFQGRRLFAPGRLAACLSGTPAMPAYGLGWWLNAALTSAQLEQVPLLLREHLSAPRLFAPGPPDLAAALGSHGQRMYVMPSLGLVVVRFARRLGDIDRFSDATFLQALLP